jgi:tetratricopeptide (TPR) repeat protein
MGVVLKGKAPDGRSVAIKVLTDAESGSALARFDRERRLLATLTEAGGFVPLLDAGTSRGGPYVVMPFLSGGTLRSRLDKGKLWLEESIELVSALATTMGRAHALGIVHRDLKPENVLFDEAGRPLIADLGLAKHHAASGSRTSDLTRTGELAGTIAYMAPEQIDDSKNVGPGADVYALGAILYECLTGTKAFDDTLVGRISDRAVEPPGKRAPDIPAWLEAVVLRALADEPGARHGDGGELARALVEPLPALAGLPKKALIAGAAAVAAFVALVVAWPSPRPAGPAPVVVAPVAPAACATPPPPAVAPVTSETAAALVERGEALEKANDVEGALRLYTRAIELDATNAPALRHRALLRIGRKDSEGAVADLTRMIDRDPRDKEALVDRGNARLMADDFAAAEVDFTRAIEIDPAYAIAWEERGLSRYQRHDDDRAIADFTKSIQLQPRRASAYVNRGVARIGKKDAAGAIGDFTTAIEIDPRQVKAWSYRGTLRSESGDAEGAIEDLSRAIELAPSAALLVNRGNLRLRRNDLDRALADFDRAVALDPRMAQAFLNRGFARDKKGDRAGALADLERVLELAPRHKDRARIQARIDALRRGG